MPDTHNNAYCDTEYTKVKLITEGSKIVRSNSVVGKCMNQIHKGYLTKSLLKKHDCIAKECPFLKKLDTTTYWETQKKIEESKKKKRADKKKAQLHKNKLSGKANSILEKAKELAKEGDYSIVFTNITQKSKSGYFLFYVSDKKYNDWEDYVPLIQSLYLQFGVFCRLVHIKDVCGQYVTIKEWNNIKKREG